MRWKTFPIRLERSEYVTPHILHLAFQRDGGDTFDFAAGQFINIHFDVDGEPTHRSYSVANSPGSGGLIEIAVSPVKGGLATDLLFNLEPGKGIFASGPYGRFILRDDEPCRYMLAGTGTGITPFRAMLPEIKNRIDRGFEFDMLLGVWSREELLYGDEFLTLARETDRFRFHACYSRETPEDRAAYERPGYVQKQYEHLNLNPASDIVYLCGNPNMIDESMVMLKEAGFETRQLRREKYLPAKH